MKPEKQFWLWVLALSVGLFALVGAQVLLFVNNNQAALEAMPTLLRENLLVFLSLALVSLLPFLVWGMRIWFQRYVLPVHRIGEDLEALLHGSPRARPLPDDLDPAGLVQLLISLMDRYEKAEQGLEDRLVHATGDLTMEKNRLESLLDALNEGVVAAGADGRILQYNRASVRLLGEMSGLAVGRSLGELVSPDVFDHVKRTLTAQLGTGVESPFVPFECDANLCGTPGGKPLKARMAPLMILGGRLEGYVLTLLPDEALDAVVTGKEVTEKEVTGKKRTRKKDQDKPPATVVPPSMSPSMPPSTPPDSGLRVISGPPEHTLLTDLRFVVFDTETTGLNPHEGDEIISLGAVVVTLRKLVAREAFDKLINPERPISAASKKIHGLGDADVQDQPTIQAVLPAFAEFARGSVLVAHHAAFDMAFLKKHQSAAGIRLDLPVLDTMLLSAVVHPNQPSHALDSLIARYGLTYEVRHSALGDARMTAELLLRLLPQLANRDIHTLGEAIAESRKTPLHHLSPI